MSYIGERVKELRNSLKLTQAGFGKRVGVSAAHISKIESGKDFPSRSLAKVICKTFDVNEEWLINGEGSMFSERAVMKAGLSDLADLLAKDSQNDYITSYSLHILTKLHKYEGLSDKLKVDFQEALFAILAEIERFNTFFDRVILHDSPKSSEEFEQKKLELKTQLENVKKSIDLSFLEISEVYEKRLREIFEHQQN
jgi:transcriptional regulator with XRE-family HTH domain